MDERQRGFVAWLGRLEAEILQMEALLNREAAALRQRRFDELPALTRDKQECAARIDERLAQLPKAAGPGEAVIEQLFDALQLRGVPEAGETWRRVKAATGRCRELNEANGAMIALLNEQTRQALAVLFGRRRQAVGYGADGQSRVDSGTRLLGAG